MKIAVVGPCASGKTTLVARLHVLGYDAHDVAQEHSDVLTMWREIASPDVLIYLDASLATIRQRLHVQWEQAYLDRLVSRLVNARAHAHFVLQTDGLSKDRVAGLVVEFLKGLPFGKHMS
jgi:deoxyadenosine/deoxycytidine kinase